MQPYPSQPFPPNRNKASRQIFVSAGIFRTRFRPSENRFRRPDKAKKQEMPPSKQIKPPSAKRPSENKAAYGKTQPGFSDGLFKDQLPDYCFCSAASACLTSDSSLAMRSRYLA
ncbi:hypothetical protein HMPREF9120_01234 [Neisseria sp. oral taxon 020 str. F0370]|nr:hypothetical protein HMPREF9120_01234 [Neisseria sp. oral taxon 020 str. F0370]